MSIQPFPGLRSEFRCYHFRTKSLGFTFRITVTLAAVSCMHFLPEILCLLTRYVHNPSRPCCSEASPQHDVVTTMLLCCSDGVLLLICHAWLLLNIALSMIVKKPQFFVLSNQRTSIYTLSLPRAF